MKLENRIALITGAGSGIGRAIALPFAEQGWTYRDLLILSALAGAFSAAPSSEE